MRGDGFGEVSAGGAVDPSAGAAGVVLFFPDRHAGLGFVDEVAAGVEGGGAVGGGDADPDGEFAELEMPGAMNAGGSKDGKAGGGFGEDAVALGLGEGGVCLLYTSDAADE